MRTYAGVSIPLLTVVVLLHAGCGGSGKSASGTGGDESESLVVVSVRRQDMISNVESTGEVQPIGAIDIKSKASGKILRLPVETGQIVERGALLAQVDTSEAATQVRQRRADLEYLQAQLTIAEGKRTRSVELLGQGMISKDDYDQAVLNYAGTRSSAISAQAALEDAETRLRETVVRAPSPGTILEKKVQEGQIISSATLGLSEGTTLLRMADLSTVRVRVLMGQADLGKIQPGQEATVVPDAYRNRRFAGRVTRIEPQSLRERDVKYFPVLVDIDNREGLLLPGMDCAVTISVSRLTGALTVATDAVVSFEDAEKIGPFLKVPQDSISAAITAAGGRPKGAAPDPLRVPTAYRTPFERPPQETGPADAAIVFVADTVTGHVRPVPIRYGMQDWNLTEVRSGLAEGMTAVVPPSAAIVQQFEALQRMR